MRTPALPSPRRIAAGAGLALLAAGLTPIAASANPAGTDLVITEAYLNGGSAGATFTNKFVEIYNPTSSSIPLTGKSLQYRSPTGTGNAGNTCALTGSVAAGGYFLVQGGSNGANGAALPTPDQVCGSVNPGAAGGTLFLSSGAAATMPTDASVVDRLGWGTSNAPEGAVASVASVTTSLQRTKTPLDTDNNSVDFTLATPVPQNSGATVGPLEATSPGAKSGQVGQAITGFTLQATGGTSPYTWTATGLPAGVTVAPNGAVSGTPTEDGTFNVTATATDSATPTAATDDVTFTLTVSPAASTVPIAQIQGTGTSTPVAGQGVKTQGVVTAAFPTGGLNGFYIQTPGADTPDASDAIFVYGGPTGFTTYPAVGDSVEVSGQAAEFGGATQIVANDAGVTDIADLGTVTPKTTIPGTTCALPGATCETLATLAPAREAMEGELLKPTADFTVTDSYDGSPFWAGNSNASGMFGEIGLAAESDAPLVTPTELYDAQTEQALIAQRTAYNNARRIVLDDGSSANYAVTGANTAQAFPWLTATHAVRVGAAVTFPEPVVFTEGFNTWRLLPTSRVVGEPSATQPQIEQTRAQNTAPQDVGGDIKLATFNVLNYFPTTGDEFVALGGGRSCSFYNDRAGNPITVNSCNPDGPRGAANNANLVRQQDKIVAAIKGSGAHIVSLEELENSAKFGKNRDFAIGKLVDALNVGTPGKWAFVPSPTGADLPPLADEDVIRTGFIYQPAIAKTVGTSKILVGNAAFGNAREPLAQAFKRVGTPNNEAFAVIVNHFKSKGSGVNDGTGQGNANPDRVAQAEALVTFADEFKTARQISRVFLAGDFNAYTHEDPIQVLNEAGYTNLESTSDPSEESYNFDGQVGSLDHVLANTAALADVAGVDIWDINASESVYYEYSRFNSNITNLYTTTPFKSSDHNPEIVGINTSDASTTEIQILGTNDFHGRLLNNTGAPFPNDAGAAVLSGAVKQLRGNNPNTVFAAAGDLIGASTFESFIQKDIPTIDALNEAGLEVSAVGNHEFDAGYSDLVDRVIPLADWEYLGANVDKPGAPAEDLLEPTWVKEMGGVQVGFIGAVTEHLDELVSPAGIEGVEIEDIVTATNREADALEAAGVDVIVLLVHEGAPSTDCVTMDDDSASDFGSIITGVNDNVDAIVSGHTHLAYNCSFPVAGWADRPVKERPVVSAGQYGTRLNQLLFDVDPATGEVQAKAQNVLDLENSAGAALYPVDGPTKAIVDAAVAEANTLGAVELGKISGPFYRAKLANGTTENRGNESTLGNLVAEVQRWATPETVGGAQIAFMNPGGMRDDMVGIAGDFPRTLTYRQAANVQSFANTLVNMDMTGAQIKTVLEQQWQPAGASRPFLRLGVSKGFTYTYDASKPVGSRITGMRLNGVPLDATASYSVTANSFLAGGGDNFGAFNQASGKQDTGKVDLAAMVDYMDEFANTAEGDAPLQVDYSQRAVGVTFPAGAPASYAPGDQVSFDLSSLSMTGPGDRTDTEVEVSLGDTVLGTAPVTTVVTPALPGFDEAGTASVSVEVPDCASGEVLTVTGNNTGTEVIVPIQVDCIATTVTGTNITVQEGSAASIPVTVTPATATGEVILGLGQMTLEAPLADGKATIALAAGALPVGVHELPLNYPGDAQHAASSTTVVVTVTAKPAPGAVDSAVTGTGGTVTYGTAGSVTVNVTPAAATGTVAVSKGNDVVGSVVLASGQGTVTLPAKSLPVGTHVLTLTYSGDTGHKPSTGSVTVTVVKAEGTVKAKVKPKRVVADKTRARVVVTVDAEGFVPTGRVKVLVAGKTYRAKLVDGKAVIKLKEFKKPGAYKAKVSYLGDDTTESDRTTVKIKVKRR